MVGYHSSKVNAGLWHERFRVLTVKVGFDTEVEDSAATAGSSSACAEPARRVNERMAEAKAGLNRMTGVKLRAKGYGTDKSLARSAEGNEGRGEACANLLLRGIYL